MKTEVNQIAEPWSRIKRNETIGGISLAFRGDPRFDNLRWRFQGLLEDFSQHVFTGVSIERREDRNAMLAANLERVRDWRSDFDARIGESEAEHTRLLAARGLLLLHQAVEAVQFGRLDLQALELWLELGGIDSGLQVQFWMGILGTAEKGRKDVATAAAKARHEKGPFSEVRAFAKEHFLRWRERPAMYESDAGFARDVMDKFPIVSTSTTIERWVRRWKSEVK